MNDLARNMSAKAYFWRRPAQGHGAAVMQGIGREPYARQAASEHRRVDAVGR
jgi:hypothetical protein